MHLIHCAYQSAFSGQIFLDRDKCAMAEDAEAAAIVTAATADGLDLLGALTKADADDQLWSAIRHLAGRWTHLAADTRAGGGEGVK